jgi:hypothetical protein
VIGVKPAGSTEWTFTAYDVSNQPGNELPSVPARPDQGLPPSPEPKSRRGR